MSRWAIKAVFYNEGGEENFTYYEEKTYSTKEEALSAINDEHGEQIAQDATLDCEIDEELKGFFLDDLDVYEVEEK